jgi:hypothetical protein
VYATSTPAVLPAKPTYATLLPDSFAIKEGINFPGAVVARMRAMVYFPGGAVTLGFNGWSGGAKYVAIDGAVTGSALPSPAAGKHLLDVRCVLSLSQHESIKDAILKNVDCCQLRTCDSVLAEVLAPPGRTQTCQTLNGLNQALCGIMPCRKMELSAILSCVYCPPRSLRAMQAVNDLV